MLKLRVWDLPTRLFHWVLAACVLALIVTGNVGGSWMSWHLRLGYTVFALVLFRVMWGLVGGRWSRFSAFVPTPRTLLRYLRGQHHHTVGHNPLGALSVVGLLLVLAAQVASGLMSDDEISFTGPLVRFVSGEWVSWATSYHKDIGKLLLIGLVCLHIVAILFYKWVRKKPLVRAMWTGDVEIDHPDTRPSADSLCTRLLALGCIAVAAGVVYGVVTLDQLP